MIQKNLQRLRFQVPMFMIMRMIMHAPLRMLYPFLGVLARGLGVDLQTMSYAITARVAVGMFNPLLASLADRYGRKAIMVIGAICFVLGCGMIVVSPTFPVFVITAVLTFLASIMFVVGLQAYIGDRVPYEQRGKYVGLIEISWSGSFLVVVPLLGLLIAHKGWLAPFQLLTVIGIACLLILVFLIPALPLPESTSDKLGQRLKRLFASPSVRACLVMSAILGLAGELIIMMFGIWMEDSFAFQVTALGGAAAVIGAAEFSGETLSSGIIDRLGIRAATNLGFLCSAIFSVTLPLLGTAAVWVALVGLFLFYLANEFTIVCRIIITSEIMPSARATLLGLTLALISLGRMLGTLLAPRLYEMGYIYNGLAAVIFIAAAWFALNKIDMQGEQ